MVNLILFFIIAFSFLSEIQAQKYPEPGRHDIIRAKDYYKDKFGYNTKISCRGFMCIPVGAEVGCSKYSYINGGSPGTKVQFCHINSIKNKDGSKVDVSGKNYIVSMGFIDEDGRFIPGLPTGEVFLADLEGKIINYSPSSQPSSTEAKTCDGNCGTEGIGNKISELAEAVVDAVTPTVLEKNPIDKLKIGQAMRSRLNQKKFNRLCQKFIQTDGSLGTLGKQAVAALKKVGWKCFSGESGSIDVSAVCPKFNTFDQTTKEYFWVWTFASMAQEESSCDPNKRNPHGSNDIADGLLQMEYSARQRRRAGRNPKFCPHTGVNSKNITFQLECSASILSDTNCKRRWSLTSTKGYWAEMRGSNNHISKHIKNFPGCK